MGGVFNYGYYNVICWSKSGRYENLTDNILDGSINSAANEYLLFLKFDNHTSFVIPNLQELITSLGDIYDKVDSPFIILTPKKYAPVYTSSEDEYVYSFSCKVSLFNSLAQHPRLNGKLDSNQILFLLLDILISEELDHEDIFVKQIPFVTDLSNSSCISDVIIPHKGNTMFLKNTLASLKHVKGLCISVGIDEEITSETKKVMNQFPQVAFYHFQPNPVGPYVIRNRLIECSGRNLIFFQDSDDISCRDRFEVITDYMSNNTCELCGSHELRLDYYNRTVQSVRYPLDVSYALSSGPWHALLHPASAISRRSFYHCGKLSEERIFANDTKFLLKCFFHLRTIKNVDEFLYIRRKHPESLTNLEDTKLDSPARRDLLGLWITDFEHIKHGYTELMDSSLIFIPNSIRYEYKKCIRFPC